MLRNITLVIALLVGMHATANLVVTLTVYNESCGNGNGSVVAQASSSAPPYTYSWSTGGTDFFIDNLVAGTYSVTVTDGLGEQVTVNATVQNLGYIDIPSPMSFSEAGWHACAGMCNGGFMLQEDMIPNAEQPFAYDVAPAIQFGPGQFVFLGYCGGSTATIQITDNAGCVGSFTTWPLAGSAATPMQLIQVNDACNGQLNGSVTVDLGSDFMLGGLYTTILDNTHTYVCCLWTQSEGLYTFSPLAPGDYYVHRQISTGVDGCVEEIPFTIADLGAFCGNVSGENWYDVDQDCVPDAAEVGIPYHVLEIQPGPEYAITNGEGQFSRNLANGSYTLAQTDPSLIPICPVVQPVPLSVNSNQQWIYLADGSTEPLDLAIDASEGSARPGFSFPLWAHVANLSPQLSGPVTVTCAFDPQLAFSSAVPAPTNIAGNVIVWDLPAFGSFASQNFTVHLDVPAGLALGTALANQFEVSNTLAEVTTANNVEALTTTVIGSYDPNDKTARTSSGLSQELFFINEDEWIDYTIRFQNTGTASAIDVVVTDTLATELDMGSFQQGVASHAFEISFLPGRVVEWRFANINLPDSNANEAASHGLMSFRIRPELPLLTGTQIANTANIYFDFNPPVITDPSMLTAEFSTGVQNADVEELTLFPVPATDQLRVTSRATIASLRILTADGRVVLRERVNAHTTMLDIGRLACGAYLLESKDPFGMITIVTFTKTGATP